MSAKAAAIPLQERQAAQAMSQGREKSDSDLLKTPAGSGGSLWRCSHADARDKPFLLRVMAGGVADAPAKPPNEIKLPKGR